MDDSTQSGMDDDFGFIVGGLSSRSVRALLGLLGADKVGT
jgi:hypothetical protein